MEKVYDDKAYEKKAEDMIIKYCHTMPGPDPCARCPASTWCDLDYYIKKYKAADAERRHTSNLIDYNNLNHMREHFSLLARKTIEENDLEVWINYD